MAFQLKDTRQVRGGVVKKFHARRAIALGHGVEGFFELGFALLLVHGWLSGLWLVRPLHPVFLLNCGAAGWTNILVVYAVNYLTVK